MATVSLETLPGSCMVRSGRDLPTLTGTERRIILKLIPPDFSRLHAIVNTIILPAYFQHIPLYLFMPWDLDALRPVAIPMPDRSQIDEALAPLWGEQLRALLASMCLIVPLPEALPSVLENGMTPVERYLAAGLQRAGLPFLSDSAADPHGPDFLLTAPDGRRIAVETDGRGFYHESQRQRDAGLSHSGVDAVVRLCGRRILQDRDGCIAAIRDALTSGGGAATGVPSPLPALSPEQMACLTPRAGAVLTLAPAGSGKTRVLTRRVVEAVRHGIEPARILCVVFNRAASEVMSERIHSQAGLPGVRICTLHSLGYDICRNAPGSPYAGFQVVTPQNLPGGLYRLYRQAIRRDFEEQSRRHDRPAPRFFPEHLVVAYEEAVSRRKRTLQPVEMSPSAQVDRWDTVQAIRVQEIVETWLREKKLMTYDDQIYRAVEVLLGSPAARAHYQSLFDVALVDEVQDLTPTQFLLVRLMALPQNNLFAVGDDDQMINTFTGADPANIRAFETWFPGAAIRTLGENYRCAPDIVVRSANVISYNRHRFYKPIRPVDRPGQPSPRVTHVIRSASMEAETLAMVHTIRRWIADGYACRDIAVLVRVKSIASPVQLALKAHGVPFVPLEEAALYTSSVGLVIGAYLDVIQTPENAPSASYVRALSIPPRYLSNEHLRAVAVEGWSMLQNPDRFPPYARAGVAAFLDGIRNMNRQCRSGQETASRFLDGLIDRFRLADYFRIREQNSRHPALMPSVDIIDLFRQLAGTCPDIDQFITRYRQRIQEEYSLVQPETPEDRNRVTITTIHRSKGDEYRGVVLFHAAENVLPHRRMIASAEDIEEERRVFYVAMTRAIERLCILTQKSRPSRFLGELDRPCENRRKRLAVIRESLPFRNWIRAIGRLVR